MQQPLGSLVRLAAGHSPSQCLTALPAPSEMGPFGVTGQAPANDLLCRTEKASLPEGGGAAQAVTERVYCAAESAAASLCAVSADPSGASVSGAVSASAAVLSAASEAAAEEAVEAAVELAEPPHAVMAAVAPTTAEAFRKSRREIIFIIVFSFIRIIAISQAHLLHAPGFPVCIITACEEVCKRTSPQESEISFVLFQQKEFSKDKIISVTSTIFHKRATSG